MGSQWLPWLPASYQPLDSLTGVSVGGPRGVDVAPRAHAVRMCACERGSLRVGQNVGQERRGGPTGFDERCVFCVTASRRWEKGVCVLGGSSSPGSHEAGDGGRPTNNTCSQVSQLADRGASHSLHLCNYFQLGPRAPRSP